MGILDEKGNIHDANQENGKNPPSIMDPLTHSDIAGPAVALLNAIMRKQGLTAMQMDIEGLQVILTRVGRQIYLQAGPPPKSIQGKLGSRRY